MGEEAVLSLDSGSGYLNLDRAENLIQLSCKSLIRTYVDMCIRRDDYTGL